MMWGYYQDRPTMGYYSSKSKSEAQAGGEIRDLNRTQAGTGMAALMNVVQRVKMYGHQAVDAYAGDSGTALRNTWGNMMNRNPNWMPGFAGEKHLLSRRGVTYNWCGPGTNVDARLIRGDNGIDALDEICKRHDISYNNATSKEQVREADRLMIKEVSKLPQGPAEKLAATAIQVKVAAEKTGIAKQEDFTNLPQLKGTDEWKDTKRRQDPAKRLRKKMMRLGTL